MTHNIRHLTHETCHLIQLQKGLKLPYKISLSLQTSVLGIVMELADRKSVAVAAVDVAVGISDMSHVTLFFATTKKHKSIFLQGNFSSSLHNSS